MMLNEIIFDMEVLPNWWCMVYSDPKYEKVNVITSETPKYIQKIKSMIIGTVFIGFNVKGYDMRILNAIISGCDTNKVYETSQAIIEDTPSTFNNYNFWNKFIFTDLYDDWLFGSLKEFESNSGMSIEESSISFDKENLTKEDKEELIHYCKHDVLATCKLYEYRKTYIDSKRMLAEMYDIRLDVALKSTNAKLAAIILEAEKRYYKPDDKFIIPEKVKSYIKDNLPENIISLFDVINNENKEANIFGNNVVFGVGGIHSIVDNNIYCKCDENYCIKKIDVTSYYPNLMMKFDYVSRSVKDPKKLEEIYNKRREFKKLAKEELRLNGQTEKWKKVEAQQLALKLIINICYGAMKNEYNALYDPYNASSLCYLGQLLLASLANKLYNQGNIKILQTNTDGIIVKVLKTDIEKITKIVHEWEELTGFEMEFDDIEIMFQRDVNNYIEVTDNPKNPYELKGKWSNQADDNRSLSNLNAPITHKAILNYYTKNIPIEKTINECDNLFDYCITTKTGFTYDKTYHYYKGNPIKVNKVNRVIATKNQDYGTIYKYKLFNGKPRYDKIADIPEHCILVNEDIKTFKTNDLDKEWYINFAKNKIETLKAV